MHVSEALGQVSERLGGPRPDVLTAVFGRWESIVGDAMAAHVRPLRLQQEALVVSCDHPAWATQVRHLAPDILARVQDACGAGPAPERIEVRVRP
jgi:predicted nucleic acid-binding Zn ribbon protein